MAGISLTDTIEILNREGGSVTREERPITDLRAVLDSVPAINYRASINEDFLATAGATLPAPWAARETSPGGTPVMDYVANAANGEYKILHDATSEAQNMTLYFGDSLFIDITKKPIFECRVKVAFSGSNTNFSADQRAVFGVGSARNATLDSMTLNAWFRLEGANLNIFWETDDNVSNVDDQDSGVDIVDDTYITFRIDMSNLGAVGFYINGTLVGTGVMTGATGNIQPFIEIQKDAGIEEEDMRIDYASISWDRS